MLVGFWVACKCTSNTFTKFHSNRKLYLSGCALIKFSSSNTHVHFHFNSVYTCCTIWFSEFLGFICLYDFFPFLNVYQFTIKCFEIIWNLYDCIYISFRTFVWFVFVFHVLSVLFAYTRKPKKIKSYMKSVSFSSI